jgi:hypothetical protein
MVIKSEFDGNFRVLFYSLNIFSGDWTERTMQNKENVSAINRLSKSTLKKEAADSYETSVLIYQIIRRHIPEDQNLHFYRSSVKSFCSINLSFYFYYAIKNLRGCYVLTAL